MQNINSDNTPDAPRITFPCRYPVKVMGEAHATFHAEVRAVFSRHAPGVQDEHVSVRPSTKGNYVAITVVIEATGKEQLEFLFADLKTLAAVKLVL
jgi:putative lipoic acid-binding regulatory protein